MALQVRKFNLDLTGAASSNVVTDELYTNVGNATPFGLGHSRFAGSTLNIYTGAGSTGYHLVLSTDYALGSQDVSLSGQAGFNVYSTVSITNPTYQSGDLYISYHAIADLINANDQYNVSLIPGSQYIEQNSDGSISFIADVLTLGNVNTTTLTIGTQTIWDSTIGLHLQTASNTVLGAVKVDGTTITINGSGVISVPTATTLALGLVKPDGSTIDINGSGVISVPTATSSLLGLVKPDGTIITISAGAITVATATSSAFGVVEVGTNISVTSGIISVATATSSVLGLVKPDGTTIDINGSGVISVPTATSSLLGLVKPDGAIITVTAGAITVATATALALGVVKPDGTTIDINGSGVVSVPTATTLALGLVKPDGTTIDINGSGVISVPTATSSLLGLVKPDGAIITVTAGAITVATATTLAFGVVKPDGTTITISSGVISAVAGSVVLVQAGSSTIGAVQYNGTTQFTGMFDGGAIAPIHTIELNYDGNLYVNSLISTIDSAIHGLTIGTGPNGGTTNTAFGISSLTANTGGDNDTAIGYHALLGNTSGSWNTGIGASVLVTNSAGSNNTAFGYNSLNSTTGSQNLGIGSSAGSTLTTGSNNILIGYNVQPSIITVSNEVDIGNASITTLNIAGNTIWTASTGLTGTASFSSDITVHSLTIGLGSGANTSNIVLGTLALVANTSGSSNLAIGFETLQYNTSGSNNVALGYQALQTVITGSNNTGIGYLALQNTTGSNNTALGYDAGGNLTSGSDVICIGYNAQPSSGTVSNEITIGDTGIQTFRIGTTTIWTASGGLQVPTATSSTLGVVEPDNITITINGSGVITAVSGYVLPVATTSSLGGVIPDGSSIAVSPTGVISIDSFFLDNFCKSSDFSSGLITGWIYSGCLTLSVTSVDPLSGTYSGLISSNEPIGTGGYVAYPFTIPLGLINSLLEINYSFQGGTNFNPLIPLSLQMFDVTNNVYLSGSFPCLAGIGTNSAIFLTNSNSTSYQLRFVYSIPSSDLVALVIMPGNTVIQAFTNFSQFNTWTYMIDEISILPSRNQLLFNGPSQTAGTFDISNNIPISTKRLNLNADLYVTDLMVTGNVFAAAVYNAVWNDLAEFMSKAVNDNAEPGDVLVQTDKGLMKSSNKSDKAVVGVYSDSYGFALGASDQSSKYPVGLAGVVRVKVREPLEIGDLLISDVDGYATKIIEPTFGLVIGKVLENKIDYETSRIKMLVFTK